MQTARRLASPQIKALKVLVVDDQPYMRKVTRTILAAIGIHNILEAADGASGLEMARINRPDLIIVDWEMPMLDGAQFVQMIRTSGEILHSEVPIIVLSAYSDEWRVIESARIGANEFVRKPVSIKTLEDRIVAILNRPRPTAKREDRQSPLPRPSAPVGNLGLR